MGQSELSLYYFSGTVKETGISVSIVGDVDIMLLSSTFTMMQEEFWKSSTT